jgi:hypothetical protein
MKRVVLVSGLCMAVAGCNAPSRDSQFVASTATIAPVQSFVLGQPESPVPAEAMLMTPPEAGAIVRVRERHFRNGTRQDIVLAGGSSGENVLEVSVRTSGGDNAPRGELQMGKPSQRGIAMEAQARFPNMRLQIVTRPMSNMFGPFGLAIGRGANGERCIFAWQWIDDMNNAARGGQAGVGAMFGGGGAPASLRLRMCRTNMTVDQMASFMEGLRPSQPAIERVVRLDRRMIGPSGVADTSVGGHSGGAIMPMDGSLESALGGASPAAAPRAVAAAPRPAPRVVRSEPAPPPARTARPRSATQPERIMEPYPQQPSGPRYLAPVEGAPQASAMPHAPTPAPRLNSSLPSRAFLGPTAGQN